ncbi:pyrroline-5-carboxylate reductase [Lentibacillus populi]|uniref:Pyrroline-5-carboxylate reductase n=1 Tax=Lentibacillus populi TaxID=1827502 RepID=A0A9W5X5F1_9BACI|nr:pyrroline-5-carboxylate reductase [Lentibacillus populi]MBT2217200.1 pyrroline-5-carboxylate reductase [Virgibacillus dakarensis]GGB43308.1 pyrroline-5-carboxylate reductase [Lentibacillus populi]
MVEKICFVGAGSMAESIISGILHNQFLMSSQIVATNKNNRERLDGLQHRYDIDVTTDRKYAIDGADIIMLATKPYDIVDAINQVKSHVKPNQLIISVVAGIATGFISERLGENVPVVRAMPNTSASIGFSATAITAGENAGAADLELAESLFKTIGLTTIVDEGDMHTVTGISGSGPAYFYYLVEAMEKAALKAGLDNAVAIQLITQTIIGAGEMLKHSGDPASVLREKITSPGGTTQAAIETLEANDFQQTVMDCVESARKRSIELGEKWK